MDEQEISIKVLIGDRNYPLKINAAEEEQVRRAAKLINEKAKFYRENYSVKDKQDALALTALEFASEALLLTRSSGEMKDNIESGLSYLESLIDSATDL